MRIRLFSGNTFRSAATVPGCDHLPEAPVPDRKSTRLNSSHLGISYAVFCLKKLSRSLDLSVTFFRFSSLFHAAPRELQLGKKNTCTGHSGLFQYFFFKYTPAPEYYLFSHTSPPQL